MVVSSSDTAILAGVGGNVASIPVALFAAFLVPRLEMDVATTDNLAFSQIK